MRPARLQSRRDPSGASCATDLLISAEAEHKGATRGEVAGQQVLDSLKHTDKRAFHVERTASPHAPLRDGGAERRMDPAATRGGIHHILVR